MEAITAELIDTGTMRDARGRRLEERREREPVIAAYEGSGLTQRKSAEREGIKFYTFVTWFRRHRDRGATQTFTKVKLAKPAVNPMLEVVLPNGLVVRGVEAGPVAALARRLSVC